VIVSGFMPISMTGDVDLKVAAATVPYSIT
jgi:hypothetical protein